MKNTIFLLPLFILFSCHNPNHEGHGDHEGHDHGTETEEHEAVSFSRWTSKSELFIELDPLVVGVETELIAHFNNVTNFKAVTNGELNVVLMDGEKTISSSFVKISKLGIFKPKLKPSKDGNFKMLFLLKTPEFSDTITLENIWVAKTKKEAGIEHYKNADKAGEIIYLKEQAWHDNFATTTAEPALFGQIIHSSGRVQPSANDIATVVAKSNGVVRLRKLNLSNGSPVGAGELLFLISGEGISEDDLEMNFRQTVSEMESSKSDLDRKKQLSDENIISKREYEQALNRYETAKAAFDRQKTLYEKGSNRHLIISPWVGYLSQLLVTEGQYVEAGQPLAHLLRGSKQQVSIDVAPRFIEYLGLISEAVFVNPYNGNAYSLKDLSGRLLSFDRIPKSESRYTAVYFEVNNHPDLPAGSMVEAYLQTKPSQPFLGIPKTALTEEMGSYVVYVQCSGESFERRVVQIGQSDGKTVQILNGLKQGERVVSKGSVRIKQASMKTDAPAHGHVH